MIGSMSFPLVIPDMAMTGDAHVESGVAVMGEEERLALDYITVKQASGEVEVAGKVQVEAEDGGKE